MLFILSLEAPSRGRLIDFGSRSATSVDQSRRSPKTLRFVAFLGVKTSQDIIYFTVLMLGSCGGNVWGVLTLWSSVKYEIKPVVIWWLQID